MNDKTQSELKAVAQELLEKKRLKAEDVRRLMLRSEAEWMIRNPNPIGR